MARTKQTTRYQSKEELRSIDELHGRTTTTEEPTDPVPDTPVSINTTVPAAVLSTAGTSLVTTITTTGPTSVSTIIDQSGTNTIIIISTAVPAINIESRNDTSSAAASTQQVIDIESDSSEDEVEAVPDPKCLKTDKD
jgi:hypothetical protein